MLHVVHLCLPRQTPMWLFGRAEVNVLWWESDQVQALVKKLWVWFGLAHDKAVWATRCLARHSASVCYTYFACIYHRVVLSFRCGTNARILVDTGTSLVVLFNLRTSHLRKVLSFVQVILVKGSVQSDVLRTEWERRHWSPLVSCGGLSELLFFGLTIEDIFLSLLLRTINQFYLCLHFSRFFRHHHYSLSF